MFLVGTCIGRPDTDTEADSAADTNIDTDLVIWHGGQLGDLVGG